MGRKSSSLGNGDATRIEVHGLRMSDKYRSLTDSQEPLVDELLQLARDGARWAETAEADAATGTQQTTLPIAEFRGFCRLVALLARGWAEREQQLGQDLLARAIAAWKHPNARQRKSARGALAAAGLGITGLAVEAQKPVETRLRSRGKSAYHRSASEPRHCREVRLLGKHHHAQAIVEIEAIRRIVSRAKERVTRLEVRVSPYRSQRCPNTPANCARIKIC
jgi:hypothetical protein